MAVFKVKQRGAIVVMTVFLIVILIGFAALALDLGRLYVLRTEMQNAADAAALAAAAELNGRESAIDDAVLAATNLLIHQGRFSDSPELLKNLQYDADNPDTSAFVFYSWIGAELDPDQPAGCDTSEDPNKCRTTDPAEAHYVKVKLYPELIDDEAYQISLYFLPILTLFVDDGVPQVASTRVDAVAGAGANFCNYPPMFMCAFAEGEGPSPSDPSYNPTTDYPGIAIGAQVKLKDRDASSPWGPGNVGFLQTAGDVVLYEDTDTNKENPIALNGNQAIAAGLGSSATNPCSPAIVSTAPGVRTQQTRKGFNTRFGLYEDFEKFKKTFPSAPDAVDYPRDDIFFEGNPSYDPESPYGSDWANTECLSTGGTTPAEPACHSATRPEQFDIADYFKYYHNSNSVPPSLTYRYSVYEWELAQTLGGQPSLDSNHVDIMPLDDTNNYQQTNCFADSKPGQKNCLIHNGDPAVNDDAYGPTTPIGDADRRVMFVAVIKCDEYNIQGNSPDIDLGEYGAFHKFFITQHVQPPPFAEFYAEYLGPVNDQELQELKHTVIQLYD